ncbi:MAG: J domain-containing protein [Puniceicoccales bacterium]|nr:J domain-containing protein [Puniceicoccales bacterium]
MPTTGPISGNTGLPPSSYPSHDFRRVESCPRPLHIHPNVIRLHANGGGVHGTTSAQDGQSPLSDAVKEHDVPCPTDPPVDPEAIESLAASLCGTAPFTFIPTLNSAAKDDPERDSKTDRISSRVEINPDATAAMPNQFITNGAVYIDLGELFAYGIWNIEAEDRELVDEVLDIELAVLMGNEDAAVRAEAMLKALNEELSAANTRTHASQEALISCSASTKVERAREHTSAIKRVCLLSGLIASLRSILNPGDDQMLQTAQYDGGVAVAVVDPATDARARKEKSQNRSNSEALRKLLEEAEKRELAGDESPDGGKYAAKARAQHFAEAERLITRNACKTLGISPGDATNQRRVRRAHRKLSTKLQPGKNPGMDTTAAFHAAQEAYAHLCEVNGWQK